MKKLCYWWMYVFCIQTTTAQSVGIGTTTPDASARLEINSTSQGILIPKLTAAQRNSIANPATGLMVFQTDGVPGFCWYNGSAWVNITSGQTIGSTGYSASYNRVTNYAGSYRGYEDGFYTAAQFSGPAGIAVDADGNVLVADSLANRIRKIFNGGQVTTFAGTSDSRPIDGPGNSAGFSQPTGLAIDAAGNLFVAEKGNRSIRKIDGSGVVSTFAASFRTDLPPGVLPLPGQVQLGDIAIDAAGNIFITENNRILKITGNGVTVLAGGGSTPGFIDGVGTAARFDSPTGLTVDAAGNVYVADRDNHAIRKIVPDGTVTTIAGDGNAGFNDALGNKARFNHPFDVAIDAAGNLYVTDFDNHRIRMIAPNGRVTTFAGTGMPGSLDGDVQQAQFFAPYGIAVTQKGDIYITDSDNYRVRKINRQ